MNSLDLSYFDHIQYSLRYKLIKNIKHPQLGDCQLVHEKLTSHNYLLKEKEAFSLEEKTEIISIINSVRALENNQNFVKLHAYTFKQVKEKPYQCRFMLFFEYFDQDLEKDLALKQKSNELYKEAALWKVLQDLVHGLLGLESKNFLKNVDLKLANVYITRDIKDMTTYKLFYYIFGLSPLDQISRGTIHYKFYLAQEEIENFQIKNTDFERNSKTVVFSLGVALLNLASANATYDKIYKNDRLCIDENVLSVKQKYLISNYSQNFSSLIMSLLAKSPYARPDLQEIRAFFYKSPVKLKNDSISSFSINSFELCKPEELANSKILEKEVLKQSLANGIDRVGPVIDSSFELKKSLLQINNKNLDEKLENLKKSFHIRMTLLHERKDSKENKESFLKVPSKPYIGIEKTAEKNRDASYAYQKIDLQQTLKKFQPVSQKDYVSDSEWTEKTGIKSTEKMHAQLTPKSIPEFIKNLEKTMLFTANGNLKKGMVQIAYPEGSKFLGQTKHPGALRHGIGVYYFGNGDMYLGEWEDNKIQGKGVYYFAEGEYYEGNFSDFQRNGGGIYQYSTGNRYEGEWANDKKNGFGVFSYGNNETYEGSWLDDEKHGEGIYTFSNGDKFVGRWQKGKKTGKGMVIFEDKGTFEGEWLENYANGYGVLKYYNGDVFEGNYQDGFKQGGGIYTHIGDGGSKYAGQWLDDERTGNGVYYYSNGDKYTGTFYKGKRNGNGEYAYLNGDLYSGNWKDDKKNGVGEFKFKNGGFYNGEWRDNVIEGNGFMMYCNGDHYEGEWKNGLKHGHGVYFWAEGMGFEGSWEDDEMNLKQGNFISKEGIRF